MDAAPVRPGTPVPTGAPTGMRAPQPASSVVTVRALRRTFAVVAPHGSGVASTLAGLLRRARVEVTAVDDVDLDIRQGEIRALAGPNGAGKSTVIKILCGVLRPTAGEVRCLDMVPWRDRLAYVRHIGAIFGQKNQLLWELAPIDTFRLNQAIYQLSPSVFSRNLDYFIETFGLSSIVYKPTRTLSLGERMKCELSAALLHDPPLVLLDEPTIGMDVLAKEAVRNFIARVSRERLMTFLLTSHDLDDIESLCHRVTVINHGRVAFDGSVAELRRASVPGKRLQLTFTRPLEPAALAPWNVIEHRGASCIVALDPVHGDYGAQMRAILNALPVKDLEVVTADMESVVRELYRRPASVL